MLRASLIFVAAVLGVIGLSAGCGSSDDSTFGETDPNGDGGPGGGPFGPGPGGEGGPKPCVNLCKQQVACAGGGTTSLSGIVKDPAGKVPLYNILVYVPNAPVAAITTGASCDRCGSVSGEPLVTAITDAAGHFKLDNVPVGDNIPLVIQVGKWRRQIVVPKVEQCVDTPLLEAEIRLPKNKAEGDLPQMAITTGGADVMECLLRKIGVDDSEFTTSAENGRVHFYTGSPGGASTTRQFGAASGGATFPSATTFWSDKTNLLKYDIVILSCEGDTYPAAKPDAALNALHDYANAGGRLFASHWHRYWFNTAARQGPNPQPAGNPSPFEPFGTWNDRSAPGDQNPAELVTGKVDDSFPKGKAMKEWLVNVGASTTPGDLEIKESKHNIDAVDPARATQWISMTNPYAPPGVAGVEYLSFNTPIPAPDDQKCGRVVYSDLHVSSGDQRGQPWPQGCVQPDLSPQEKALEFMLFDLSSCIQSDSAPVVPPVPVK